MVDYLIGPAIAWDVNGNRALPSSTFESVYDLKDESRSTPLAVTDTNGLPVTPTSNGEAFLTPFLSPVPSVVLVDSAGRESVLHSVEGMRDATEDAQASAATSAAAAASSASAAQSLALPTGGLEGQGLVKASDADGDYRWSTSGGTGGVSDHGALSGLSDDDHPQYLTESRGDARYYPRSTVDTMVNNAANQNSAADRSRSNHTGTQPISSVTGLQSALDSLGGTAVNSVAGKTGNVTLVSADISDSTATGRSVMGASSAAAARSAIGAGTSSLGLGSTSSTAMRGDKILVNPSSISGVADGTLIFRTA